ncbi:MAG: hypothetical protein MHM6MM_002749 [Cercozoa sp. M6MM]
MTPRPHLFSRGWRERLSVTSRLFLFLAVLETVMLAVIALVVLFHGNAASTSDIVFYTVMSLFVVLCFLYFAIDGIARENKFQLVASVAASYTIALFVAWLAFDDDNTDIFKGELYATASFAVLYTLLLVPVSQSFGWRVFKKVGGDLATQRHYEMYMRFTSVLKFNLEISVVLASLVFFFLLRELWRILLYASAMFILVPWVMIGITGVRTESKKQMWLFGLLGLVEPVVLCVIGLTFDFDTVDSDRVTPTQFLTTGALALVFRVLSLVLAVLCTRNFDKGLREVAFQGDSSKALLSDSQQDEDVEQQQSHDSAQQQQRQQQHQPHGQRRPFTGLHIPADLLADEDDFGE